MQNSMLLNLVLPKTTSVNCALIDQSLNQFDNLFFYNEVFRNLMNLLTSVGVSLILKLWKYMHCINFRSKISIVKYI